MSGRRRGGEGEKIRVLQIVTRLVVRGVPRHVVDLASHLDPARFEVEILAGRGEPGEGSLWEEAAARGLVTHRVDALQRAAHPIRDALALAALYRRIKQGRYDVVHTHISKAGVLGRLAAKWARVPAIVHTYHGKVEELEDGSPASRVYVMCERRVARYAHALVGVSEAIEEHLLGMGVGTAEQYRVIPNGIDLEWFASKGEWSRPEGLQGQPLIGCVCSLTREKGVDVLLRAMGPLAERYPQLQLCVVGDGPLRAELEHEARQLGVAERVMFAGIASDVRPWLAAFDLFVLPSRSEGTPRALLEAMAMGTGVVATRTGGTPEIVENGVCGVLVEPEDASDLGRGIGGMLRDATRREAFGEAGQERVRSSFGLAGMVDGVAAVYEECLGERQER